MPQTGQGYDRTVSEHVLQNANNLCTTAIETGNAVDVDAGHAPAESTAAHTSVGHTRAVVPRSITSFCSVPLMESQQPCTARRVLLRPAQ